MLSAINMPDHWCESATLVLLPGLDGTGRLFEPLLGVIPRHIPTRVITYPQERPMSLDELVGYVWREISGESRVVLLAESFSGPVAVRYAADHADQVAAVVLCASFVRSPAWSWLRHLACPMFFREPFMALGRCLLGGGELPTGEQKLLKDAIAQVPPWILADRVRQVLTVDCVDALVLCKMPILYLQAGRDRMVGRQCVSEVMAAGPQVAVRTVDGPHLLLQARPREAWEAIEAWIAASALP